MGLLELRWGTAHARGGLGGRMVALWLLTNWAVGEWWSRPVFPQGRLAPLGYSWRPHRGGDGKMVRRQERDRRASGVIL